jgi:geranylgeranyl diphosphate synthase type II
VAAGSSHVQPTLRPARHVISLNSQSSILNSTSDYLNGRRDLFDRVLAESLPPGDTPPEIIHQAMRYAVLGGGKRVRPILAAAAAEACGGELTPPLLKHLAALELIHTYSLVHDDLPALDNDDLRRGQRTTHVVYGEAMAILTGDALLTEAFAWLGEPLPGVDPARQLRADIEAEQSVLSADPEALGRLLTFIHQNKTGKLLTVSLLLGGFLGGATEAQLEQLTSYGKALGLAFQIVDDLLDIEETAATLGKTAGKDVEQGKLTYPALYGMEAAREHVTILLDEALRNADMIGGPMNYLGAIARYVCERRS